MTLCARIGNVLPWLSPCCTPLSATALVIPAWYRRKGILHAYVFTPHHLIVEARVDTYDRGDATSAFQVHITREVFWNIENA